MDVVAEDELSNEFTSRLMSRIAHNLPGMEVELRRVPSIRRASSGKMRLIINEVAALEPQEMAL